MVPTLKEIYRRLVRFFLQKKQDGSARPFAPALLSADHVSDTVAAIIIPIRVKHQAKEALMRLQRLLSQIPECFEVVVVDDGSALRWQKEVCRLVMAKPNSRYTYLPTSKQRFSLARARNRGAAESKSEIIIFHDLDFLGTTGTYLQIADFIGKKQPLQQQCFFCIPVAFLAESGTKNYLHHLQSGSIINNWDFYQAEESVGGVKFLVQGSSCIVLNRDYFLKVGGHDESYDGHGAEDFELLHRLSLNFPIAKRPADYAVNTGSGKITEYRGFRAFFALYGEECAKSECILMHLYHPKRKEIGYYQHERNFAKLKALMLQDSSRVDLHG